jgi:hypothetical protein
VNGREPASSSWNGASLRRAALDALGSLADERAREALAHGALEVTPRVASWQGSAGPFSGHRVVLVLDAARLQAVLDAPAVEDAIRSALAAAVATRPGESLFELALRPAARALSETPYRGRQPHEPRK